MVYHESKVPDIYKWFLHGTSGKCIW